MNKSQRRWLAVFLLVLIAAFAGVYVGTYVLEVGSGGQTIVTPGWEIYDQIVGAQYGNQIYTKSSQFTTPNFISGPLWKFDVDAPNSGVPTIETTIGDIHHVDFSGSDIPNNQPAQTITVTRGNHTYILDDHIYLLTVTIRSVADVENIGGNNFNHETSWPYTYWDWPASGVKAPAALGKKFDGGVYVAFIINPWRGASVDNSVTAPTGFVLVNGWAGVMNAYVLSERQGQVENQWADSPSPDNNHGLPTPDGNAPYSSKGTISAGNQVPMFQDDGTFSSPAPKTHFDNSLSPDTRIPPSVALYLPVQIFPGCKTHADWSQVDALYPCDGYVMYNVRVDVLQSHDFQLQTAIKPPTPEPPVDYYTWAESFWTNFLHGLDPFAFLGPYEALAWWILTAGVVIFILVILVAIFAPWVLPRLASTARETAKAARGR
jgi:hypothetical protein